MHIHISTQVGSKKQKLWRLWCWRSRSSSLEQTIQTALLAMANLAAICCKLGRYQEAEPLEGTVLEQWKELLGTDHPDTLLAMENLATASNQLGR
ncbi:hypothetical protein K438DRAFT_2095951, partial [Mycena galopus ATCC 62051]